MNNVIVRFIQNIIKVLNLIMKKEPIMEFPLYTDERFPAAYRAEGCYMHTIAKIAWDKRGWEAKDLIAEIVKRSDEAIERGFCLEDYLVVNPDNVFEVYGLKTKYTDSWEPPSRMCKENEFEILCFARYKDEEKKNLIKHFVQGDGQGNVVWDGYGDSRTVREGWLDSKRIFAYLGR